MLSEMKRMLRDGDAEFMWLGAGVDANIA